VQDSLSFLVEQFPEVAAWKASSQRLLDFQIKIEESKFYNKKQSFDSTNIECKNLSLHYPNGKIMIKNVNLQINPGERVMISGPSGIGKSSLLRYFAGIWPYYEGVINLPAQEQVFFLPQKPYMPLGTLLQALCYPFSPSEISIETIETLLDACLLKDIKISLSETKDWSHVLSLGEQQRVSFLRLMLQKPKWIILDEATSSLDEKAEEKLYSLIMNKFSTATIISIGHREGLRKFHNKFYKIEESYEFSTLKTEQN
jgi:putative ATP-binding cassette transporter